jgi:hypothetical protein
MRCGEVLAHFKKVVRCRKAYVTLGKRLKARRQRKAHQLYLKERAWQESLRGRDAQEAVHAAALGTGASQQVFVGQIQ